MLGFGRKVEAEFFEAVWTGEHGKVVRLLQSEPNLIEARVSRRMSRRFEGTDAGATALHLAVERGQTELVQLLLQAGASANLVGAAGSRALHGAALYGRTELVSLLLEAGADPQLRDMQGRTALYLAAAGGHKDAAAILLRAGTDANTADRAGNSALHAAIAACAVDVVELLIDAGADVNAGNRKQRTPLHQAVVSAEHSLLERAEHQADGRDAVVERITRLLLQAGADPNALDVTDETPLDLLSFFQGGRSDHPLVRLLQAHGADWSRYRHRYAQHAAGQAVAQTMHGDSPVSTASSSTSASAGGGHQAATAAGPPVALGERPIRIGRDPSCDITYRSRTLSRKHSQVERSHGGYVIRDLGSRNGTVVDDHRITGRHLLRPGEVIQLGAYSFEFDGSHLIPLSEELPEEELENEGMV